MIVQWICAVLFIALFLLLACINGYIFFCSLTGRKLPGSPTMLVGGIAGCIGLIIMPLEGSWKWAWLPLFLDYGTIPGLIYFFHVMWQERHEKPPQ